jgi:hypothetical protein
VRFYRIIFFLIVVILLLLPRELAPILLVLDSLTRRVSDSAGVEAGRLALVRDSTVAVVPAPSAPVTLPCGSVLAGFMIPCATSNSSAFGGDQTITELPSKFCAHEPA